MRRLRYRLSASRAVRLLIISATLVIGLFGTEFPGVMSLNNTILSWRFAGAPRPASGKLVFLAIDKQTLDQVGTWPWPRGVYADLLDKLYSIGVDDIFVDVDFSTPSSAKEDARLTAALSNAGGGVILPVFKQHQSANAGSETVVTRPISSFGENAWPAFANVTLDHDGTVRRFELSDILDGQMIPSVAATLSKMQLPTGTSLIDYSIQPSSVPTISLAEVMKPDFDGIRIKGRSVVIGAYATELKDIFPVPVYGQLSGPMLHVLSAETLLQRRMLKEGYQRPVELAIAAAIIAAALALRTAPPAVPFLLAFGLMLGGEALAFLLQRHYGVVMYTATCWLIFILGLLLTLTEKVDFSRFLAEVANAEQRNIRRLLRRIVTDSTDAVLAFDHSFVIFEESDSARSMLGSDASGYKGRTLASAIPGSLHDIVLKLAADYEREPHSILSDTHSFSICCGDTQRHLEAALTISPVERPGEAGSSRATTFVGSMLIRDITARRLYEEKLRYLSHYDDLTGLMNRRAFAVSLRDCSQPCYVAAIGLHRFSVLNATMGRNVGDEVLRAVAGRLKSDERIAVAGRLGGDVFVIALRASDFKTPEDSALSILGLFVIPIELSDSEIRLSVHVGICPDEAIEEDAGLLVERAEHALDAARMVAGSGWRLYDAAAAQQQHLSRELEHAMRESLQKGEFFLVYQPQVDLCTGELKGAEALLRWKHPQFGTVSPGTFIPVAEASGFVCELGRWALEEACIEAKNWPDGLTVAVNVAPLQLIRTDLVKDVKNALAKSQLPASRLHLEITESAFIEQGDRVLKVITELRTMGVNIALDDFGTGYSSLSALAGFPLDKLKIDQSFVRGMAKDLRSCEIVQTIKRLATSLSLGIVAEGVETEAEWRLLAAMGCEVGQGYFFGKPQSSSDLIELIKTTPWMVAA